MSLIEFAIVLITTLFSSTALDFETAISRTYHRSFSSPFKTTKIFAQPSHTAIYNAKKAPTLSPVESPHFHIYQRSAIHTPSILFKMFSKTLVALVAVLPTILAHSWIESMSVIAPNGTMIGAPGYARGNVQRSNPGFGDPTMVNLLPPGGSRPVNDILPTDLMCKSTQTTANQTDGSPSLQAAPGSGIALRYQENGHVTLPQNQPGKPDNRGTVYVYGTTQPSSSDTLLGIHRQWNAAGTGGDGRGVLLSTQNFDDGQCYQVNGGAISTQRQAEFSHTANQLMGANLWCQQDIALPASVTSGTYTLYWVWDWPTMPGTAGFPDGKQEIYTTCMDVDITNSGSDAAESFSKATANFETGQDLNSAGISSQVQDITNPTAVASAQTIPFSASATGPAGSAVVSAQAASATPTGIQPFQSDHLSSTFSVLPIGATPASNAPAAATSQLTAAPAATSQAQGNGFGGHHPNGSYPFPPNMTHARPSSFPPSAFPPMPFGPRPTNLTAGNQFGTGQATAITNAATAAQAMVTVTQYDQTVYETEFQTVTANVKREGMSPNRTRLPDGPTPTFQLRPHFSASADSRWHHANTTVAVAAPSASASASAACSKRHGIYRLRARSPFYPYKPEDEC